MEDLLAYLSEAYDHVRYLQDQGHNEDALALARQLVELTAQLLGPGHPDVAEIHATVGILCRRTGRYELVAQRQHLVLEIRRGYFGEAHDAVASTLSNLGVLYQVMGRHPEAAEYHRRALAIRTANLQPDALEIAFTRSNLATVLVSQERYDEAEQLLLPAAATFDKSAASPDWRFVEALANLGGLYGVTGRHGLARAPLGGALAIARQFLPGALPVARPPGCGRTMPVPTRSIRGGADRTRGRRGGLPATVRRR
jgi:tetratricopeptide (TPR) repeat protein